jgi:hypothetical protein
VLLQAAKVAERPLANPGRPACFDDIPFAGVDAKEANPILDLVTQPMVFRVVNVAGGVQTDLLAHVGVSLQQISFAPVPLEKLGVIDQVIGHDPVGKFPINRFNKPLVIGHMKLLLLFERSIARLTATPSFHPV